MLRLIIASPFPAMRAGLRTLLTDPDLQIMREVVADDHVVHACETMMPQVLIYDLAFDPDGLCLTLNQLRQQAPGTRVLVLSESVTDTRLMRALQAGARGCLAKIADADELTLAVRQIANGETVLPPTATSTLIQQLAEGTSGDLLSPRELQVVRGVAAGMTNKAIALTLSISDHTVKFHLASAMSKLGAASRAEAVALAIQKGLLAL